MSSRCDVAVIGAGPAGIAAAAVAAENGQHVCLIDDNPDAGGQIWRGHRDHASRSRVWLDRLHASGCAISAGMRVVAEVAPGVLRLEGHDSARDLAFTHLILAAGARERFLPFPGWTLPGVLGAGAAQAFLKSGFNPAGRRAVVAGSGPLLLAVAAGLARKGARVLAICEQAQATRLARFGFSLLSHPGKLVEGAAYRLQSGLAPYRAGCWITKAEGNQHLESVTIFNGRTHTTIPCDLLACGYHLVPNLELPQLLGCRIANGAVQVNELQQSSRSNIYCAGELTGIGGLDKALLEGQIAAWAIVGQLNRAQSLRARLQEQLRFMRRMQAAFALRPELRSLPCEDTIVCRCEDVPCAVLQSHASWRSAKLQTRAGMGACQGRVCGAAAEFLFGWEKSDSRPPILPATVGSLAARPDASVAAPTPAHPAGTDRRH